MSEMKMVKIKLPKEKKEQPDAFVAVNDRTYLIQRGVEVQVPWFVAEVLQHRDEVLDEAMAFDAANAK